MADGDFGAVGDANPLPFTVDDWVVHCVKDGGALDDSILGWLKERVELGRLDFITGLMYYASESEKRMILLWTWFGMLSLLIIGLLTTVVF